MLMGEFATAVKYELPIKVVVIKNNTLGQIKWEQMVFLGNPEYGCELQPIDFAAVRRRPAAATGFTIDDPATLRRRAARGARHAGPGAGRGGRRPVRAADAAARSRSSRRRSSPNRWRAARRTPAGSRSRSPPTRSASSSEAPRHDVGTGSSGPRDPLRPERAHGACPVLGRGRDGRGPAPDRQTAGAADLLRVRRGRILRRADPAGEPGRPRRARAAPARPHRRLRAHACDHDGRPAGLDPGRARAGGPDRRGSSERGDPRRASGGSVRRAVLPQHDVGVLDRGREGGGARRRSGSSST